MVLVFTFLPRCYPETEMLVLECCLKLSIDAFLLGLGCLSVFPGAHTVTKPPAMWETWIQSLGWEDPLEEGMAPRPSVLAWRIPVDRGA